MSEDEYNPEYRPEDYPPAKEAIDLVLRFQHMTEQEVRIEVASTVADTRQFLQVLWDSFSYARRAWLEALEDTRALRNLIGLADMLANLGTAVPGASFNYAEAAMWMFEIRAARVRLDRRIDDAPQA